MFKTFKPFFFSFLFFFKKKRSIDSIMDEVAACISFFFIITCIMAVIIKTPAQPGLYDKPKQTQSGSLLFFLLYERHHIVLQFHYIDLIVPLCLF